MSAPGRVARTFPLAGEAHDLSTDAGRAWLRDEYSPAPDVRMRLNMITALTGAAVGADGTSETLSNRTDRAILGVIRAWADAVLVGAATVRAEGYVTPRAARLAILTATGDLRGHRLGDDLSGVLLVCPSAAAEAVRERAALPGVDILAVGDGDRLDPREVLAALAGRGIERTVCEGGPAVASMFARADLIDEYCVTVAPALAPAAHAFLPLDSPLHTEVAGMLVDDAGFSYLRLRPRRRDRDRAATA